MNKDSDLECIFHEIKFLKLKNFKRETGDVSYKIDSLGNVFESFYTDGWFVLHTTTSFPFDKESNS